MLGKVFTVTVIVDVQPPSEQVIIEVPELIPVTTPVLVPMVETTATDGVLLVQTQPDGPPNVVTDPSQASADPVIVGEGITCIFVVAVTDVGDGHGALLVICTLTISPSAGT